MPKKEKNLSIYENNIFQKYRINNYGEFDKREIEVGLNKLFLFKYLI